MACIEGSYLWQPIKNKARQCSKKGSKNMRGLAVDSMTEGGKIKSGKNEKKKEPIKLKIGKVGLV